MTNYSTSAQGISTVTSTGHRPECHAPSGVRVNDYSAKVNARGYSPRDVQRDKILAFWESLGWAKWQKGGKGGGGRWVARDVLSGSDEWLPLAGQGEDTRHDVIVFSHVIPAEDSGAWCACGLIPERGARNHLRGAARIEDMPDDVTDAIATWPAFWFANYARAASVKRLTPAQRAALAQA